jgi:hypothetical protein
VHVPLFRVGVVTLMKDFTVCEKDKPLTPEQAQILVSLSACIASQ